jgi:hypothetical protein
MFNAAFAAGSDPAEANYKTIIDLAPEDIANWANRNFPK